MTFSVKFAQPRPWPAEDSQVVYTEGMCRPHVLLFITEQSGMDAGDVVWERIQ